MAQISLPLRIAFVVTIAFIVVWFAALKPKPADGGGPSAATQAPHSDAGAAKQIVEKARDTAQTDIDRAAATGVDSTAATGAATSAGTVTGSTTATRPTPAPPVSDAALSKLPRPVSAALREGDVLLLFFHDGGKSADDRAVRRALARVERQQGHLRVHSARIDSIARYAPIARGVAVTQSPTIVVVDKQRKTDMLVGFVDAQTISQAVADALRASGYRFSDGVPYVQAANAACREAKVRRLQGLVEPGERLDARLDAAGLDSCK